MNDIVIKGGAGEYEAAAIVSVIQHVLDTQASARENLPPANVPPAWVRSGRHIPVGRFVPPVVPDPGINWPR